MNNFASQSTSKNPTFQHGGKLAQTPPDVVQRIAVSLIKPSPENNGLYSRFDTSDRQNQKLIADVRENGVRNPLILTRDHYIISGHRRYNAARIADFLSSSAASCVRLLSGAPPLEPSSIT